MEADVSQFVKRTICLLNLERKTEIEETKSLQENISPKELQRRGVCLLKLRIRSRKTGLYGRHLLTFELRKTTNPDGKLPSHSLTPGDIVGLGWLNAVQNASDIASGIVSHVTQTAVTVAFNETADSLSFDDEGPFKLVKLANDVTHKRIKSALDSLSKYRDGPAAHLIDVFFGNVSPGPPLQIRPYTEGTANIPCEFFNEDLDNSQRQAVKFALCQREVAIVHGPPGTGKTTTVVEIILQAVKKFNMKVLACAPSNVAVDNLVEKLVKVKVKVVRLGHPARLLSVVQEHSLDALLSNSDGTAIVQDVRKDIDDTLTKVRKSKNVSEKKHLKQEIKSLREELRQREAKAITEILTKADVVLATNTSASVDGPLKHVKPEHFDLVIIDEAAQSLEAGCWVPLLQAKRCVLAGDHLQLPPTIISKEAAKQGLEVTLMERLIKLLGDDVVRMLTTQYRMNEAIMKWSSEKLYEGRLQADASVKNHLLKDLPGIEETEETILPLLLIDTTGCDVSEKEVEDEVSKGNEGEADIVASHVTALISAGLQPTDIAVIAPYNLQVDLLRLRLASKYPALEIKSVDGFQGREKEAVVISLVRSNNKGEVGFLAEHRRINVAITRARRHLAVIADSETVSHDDFLKSLMDYMSTQGEVRSAHEYIRDSLPTFNASKPVCNFENREYDSFLSKISKAGEKKNGLKANESHKKESDDLKIERKFGSNTTSTKVDIDKKESDETTQLDTSSSTLESSLSNNSSSVKVRNNSNDFQQPPSSKASATAKYSLETLEKELSDFVQDASKLELPFPKTLNSQQRFNVHCIAEKLNLVHESQGEGKDRYIVVRKALQPMSKGDDVDDEFLKTCCLCKKRVPSCNLELHSLRCEQQLKSKTAQTDITERKDASVSRTTVKPHKTGAKTKPSAPKREEEEDFDKLLASFTKLDTQCAYDVCKQSVRTLGQTCQCCGRIYCLSHHIPEVHGCGEAAKRRARYLANRPTSAKPKASDATRKAQLHRKLDKKLNEMSEQRKIKKKGGNSE
ncbi:DNA-binding protein SMUBP-2-like [Montipora capricornis]|uniref:DNA-binding protein SMUBP-2-like n=1 Tax=Montipora capricornis TaxID=246305 RepID=UPI0035F1F9B0